MKLSGRVFVTLGAEAAFPSLNFGTLFFFFKKVPRSVLKVTRDLNIFNTSPTASVQRKQVGKSLKNTCEDACRL